MDTPISPAHLAVLRQAIEGDALEQDDALALLASHDFLGGHADYLQVTIKGLRGTVESLEAHVLEATDERDRLRVLLAASWGLAS